MASLIRAVQAAAITTGGPTQDFPTGGHPDFSASEPVKAALVFFAPSTTNGTALDHARLSFGFTDGTRHRCISIRGRDAQTTKSNVRNSFNDVVASIYAANATTASGVLAHSAFTSSNRFTGSWSTLPPAAWLINTILFGGSDCQAYVGEAQGSASENGTVDVNTTTDSSFTFDWNVLFFISRGVNAFDGTSANNTICSIGVAIWDGTTIKQGCVSFSSENTALAATAVGCCVEDDVVQRTHLTGGPTLGDGLELTARASSAGHRFTLTKRGANGTQPRVAFLALNLPGLQGLDLRARGTRTSNGTDDWTEPGHAPQAVFGLYSRTQTLNTIAADGDGASFGCGIMTERNDTTIDEFCSAYMDADNTTTTDTKAETNNVGHVVPSGTGAAGTLFDLTSFDTQGANFNYTATLAAARQMLLLSIGRPVVPILGNSNQVADTKAALAVDRGTAPRSVSNAEARLAAAVDRGATPRSTSNAEARLAAAVDRGATPRSVSTAETKVQMVVDRGVSARSVDSSVSRLAQTVDRFADARSVGGSIDRSPLAVDRGLSPRFVSESLVAMPLNVVAESIILLSCYALGESAASAGLFVTFGLAGQLVSSSVVRLAAAKDSWLQQRADGQASTSAALGAARWVAPTSVGGSVARVAADRLSWLPARAVGEGLARLPVGVDRFMTARSVGTNVQLGALTAARFITSTVVPVGSAATALGVARSLTPRTDSGSVSLLEITYDVGVSVFLTCSSLSEAFLAAALAPIRFLSIGSVSAAEARTSVATGRSLSAQLLGSGIVGLPLVRAADLAGARSVSTTVASTDLTRQRALTVATEGQSSLNLALLRSRLLAVVSTDPSQTKLRLDVARSLTALSDSPQVARLGLALEHFLQARTVGEQNARVSVFLALLNRYAQEIRVTRASASFVVTRASEEVVVTRPSLVIPIPYK